MAFFAVIHNIHVRINLIFSNQFLILRIIKSIVTSYLVQEKYHILIKLQKQNAQKYTREFVENIHNNKK